MTIDTLLLTRAELAAALTSEGFRTTISTLATFACRGCGPEPFAKYGNKPLYHLPAAITWATERRAASRRATLDAMASARSLR